MKARNASVVPALVSRNHGPVGAVGVEGSDNVASLVLGPEADCQRVFRHRSDIAAATHLRSFPQSRNRDNWNFRPGEVAATGPDGSAIPEARSRTGQGPTTRRAFRSMS